MKKELTPFPTLPQLQVLAEFRHEMRNFLRFSEQAATQFDLQPQQHQLLLQIAGAPAGAVPTIGYVAERMGLRHHTTVELSKRCEEASLIVRRHQGEDRRCGVRRLTRAGNRLLKALSAALALSNADGNFFCWTYDNFGNRTKQSHANELFTDSACSPASGSTYTVGSMSYSANNQIASGSTWQNAGGTVTLTYDSDHNPYDAAGNLTYDGTNNYAYDAEGRVCAMSTTITGIGTIYTGYLYDAEGRRVAKGTHSSLNCSVSDFTASNMYILGPDGQTMTETDGSGNWVHTDVSAGAAMVTYTPTGLNFQFADWLGTRRVQTDYAGANPVTFQSLPFGELISSLSGDTTEKHFTGKERDAESGNDYFGKRYYASSMGRWMSPDVVNVTEERMMNPSSTLNKYAYGANNPLKYVDPDGEDITYFYDQSGFAGHAVLFAYNQANGDSAIESFGPASKSVGYRIAEPFMPVFGTGMFDMAGVKSADDLRSTYASMTIQTTPELTQQVIDFIRSNPDPKLWDVMGPNCSSEVWKILKKFKLDAEGGVFAQGNQGLTPKVLWGSLALRYNINAYGINPQNGKDYGAPRFDMFSLMWLSLPQAPQATVTATATNCVTGSDGKQHCDTQ